MESSCLSLRSEMRACSLYDLTAAFFSFVPITNIGTNSRTASMLRPTCNKRLNTSLQLRLFGPTCWLFIVLNQPHRHLLCCFQVINDNCCCFVRHQQQKKKDLLSRTDSEVLRQAAYPLYDALRTRGLDPIKRAHNRWRPDSWLTLTASTINRLKPICHQPW